MEKIKRIKMGVIRAIRGFFDNFRFFLKIYTWSETWIVIGIGCAIVGGWFYFNWAITLPFPWNCIAIYGVGIILVLLSPGVLWGTERKQ